jgi:hypothetical protein
MGLIHIKFRAEDLKNSEQNLKSWLTSTTENLASKILTKLIPKANPDFDEQIQNVKEWILEVDDEDGMPMREVGLDDKGNAIMIMPWKENYGFWSDSLFSVDNLATSYAITFSNKAEFDKLWEEFEKNNAIK